MGAMARQLKSYFGWINDLPRGTNKEVVAAALWYHNITPVVHFKKLKSK